MNFKRSVYIGKQSLLPVINTIHINSLRYVTMKPTNTDKSRKSSNTNNMPKQRKQKQSKKTINTKKEDAKLKKILTKYPDPNKPKRPLTTYFMFRNEYMTKNNLLFTQDNFKESSQVKYYFYYFFISKNRYE